MLTRTIQVPGLVDAIAAITGPHGVLTAEAEVAPFVGDRHGRHRGDALCVARPSSTGQVAAIVRLFAESGTPVVPQGGNTGVCGGAVPAPASAAVVISTSRMNRVRSVDAAGDVMVAEAGCVLAGVQAAAREAGRLFPLTLGAEGSCQIGGNVSTNAGGIAALRYGSMRDLVLGLEVVLPDGRVWDGLRRLRKDNTGYHLKDLFVGAEGTLGIVTACSLRLFPLPAIDHVAWIAVGDVSDAVELLGRARQRFGDGLAAFELLSGALVGLVGDTLAGIEPPFAKMLPWLVLIHVEGLMAEEGAEQCFADALSAMLEGSGATDAAVARSGVQAEAFWRLRHGVTEANRARGYNVTHDVALPVAEIAEFMSRADAACAQRFPDAEIHSVTHLGDGNVHYTVTMPRERLSQLGDPDAFAARATETVHAITVELGGSFAAEHGIGQRHLASLRRHKSGLELELFERLKAAFDPQGIMNPGKLVASAPGRPAAGRNWL